MIQQRHPSLRIEGGNFPPPLYKQHIASVVGALKFALLLMAISGFNPFPHLNLPTPNIINYAFENKVYFCLMTFFLCNAIEGQMWSTGAFEVEFNDVPVWSKLSTGRVPSPQELLQIIDNHQRFTSSERSTQGS